MEIPYELALEAQDFGGTETETNTLHFPDIESAVEVLKAHKIDVAIPKQFAGREAHIRILSSGRPVLDVALTSQTEKLPRGWVKKSAKIKRASQVLTGTLVDAEKIVDQDYIDGMIRCVDCAGKHFGWYLRPQAESPWILSSRGNGYLVLRAKKYRKDDCEAILGQCVSTGWTITSIPFAGEYPDPEKRIWNLGAPQLKYEPIEGDHPDWDRILDHLGSALTVALQDRTLNPWAEGWKIKTGGQYLLSWIASAIRHPAEPLPYLFAYGNENCGKSIFHEALWELTTKGVVNVYRALRNKDEFNSELWQTVFAYVDEKDLSEDPSIFARVREWVTGKTLNIRKMATDAFTAPNYCHFYHCANKRDFLPIWPGDTRIVAFPVADLSLEQEVPKDKLLERLREQAPAFTHTLRNLELPEVTGRTRLPIVVTHAKRESQAEHAGPLAAALEEWFRPKDTWKGVTKELRRQSADISRNLSNDGRLIRKQLEDCRPYLKQCGVFLDIDATHKQGLTITFAKS
jgi:hypothetical protein